MGNDGYGGYNAVVEKNPLVQENGRMAKFFQPTMQHSHKGDIDGFPYMLKAVFTVCCPKCQGDADLCGTVSGNACVVNCPDCGHKETVPGRDSSEIVKALMTQWLNPEAAFQETVDRLKREAAKQ